MVASARNDRTNRFRFGDWVVPNYPVPSKKHLYVNLLSATSRWEERRGEQRRKWYVCSAPFVREHCLIAKRKTCNGLSLFQVRLRVSEL